MTGLPDAPAWRALRLFAFSSFRITPFVLLLVTASLLASGCSSRARDCSDGDQVCSEREVCDAATRLCVKNRPPKIALATPEEGSVITGMSFELSGLIDDDEARQPEAEVSLDEGATWTALALGDRGRFSVTVPVEVADGAPFPLRVRAADALRQVTEIAIPLIVDNVPPRCALRSPSTAWVGGPTVVPLRFEAVDGAGPVTARVSVDDGASWTEARVEDGEGRFDWSPEAGLDQDTVVRIEVVDANGHLCTDQRAVRLDTRPPELVLVSPSGPQPLRAGGPSQSTLDVVIEVSDPSGIEGAFVELDDGAGPHAFVGDGAVRTVSVPLPMSDHVLHEGVIRAVDAAGNIRTLPLRVIVDRVPPRIESLQPAPGTVFNVMTLGGMNAVTATWIVTDGDGSVSRRYRAGPGHAWTPLAADALSIQTSSQDDGKAYTLFLEASDSLGNVGTAQSNFVVDVVPPTLTFNHAHQARLVPHELTVTFSEPVTPQLPPESVLQVEGAPAMPGTYVGTWSGNVLGLGGLMGDTIVTATVPQGAVVDAAGNPNPQARSIQFHTAPRLPQPGTLIAADVTRIESWSDEEGVLGVFADAAWNGYPSAYRLYWVNPRTGAFEHLGHVEDKGTQAIHSVYVAASRAIAGLASERVFGVTMLRADASSSAEPYGITTWRDANGQVTKLTPPQGSQASWQLLVPTARGIGEPTSAGRIGWLDRRSDALYFRMNMNPEPVGLQPRWVRSLNENQWAVFGTDGSNLRVNERFCTVGSGGPRCEFHGQTLLTSDMHWTANLSAALVPNRLLAVITANSGRLETCYGPLNTTPCTSPPCALGTVSSQPAPAGDLYIASKNEGNRVLGARKSGAGSNVELLEKDLTQGCFPAWQSLGTVPGSVNATRWRPVRVGNRSGVLYVDGGALKLWLQ